MIAFTRMAVISLVLMTVVYVLVSIYSRSVRRESLEKEWDEAPQDGATEADRAAFIEAGMRRYENGLRKKLIWLVYVIPIVLVTLITYLTSNY